MIRCAKKAEKRGYAWMVTYEVQIDGEDDRENHDSVQALKDAGEQAS